MKKVSIISPVFKNVERLGQTILGLNELFENRYEFEVLYYHSVDIPENLQLDQHFLFYRIEKRQSFDDCVTDGFSKTNGNCVIVADLNNLNYKDYIIKLLVAWENNAQVALIKKRKEKPNIFQKIGGFFAGIVHKISDALLSIVGLNKDFCAMRGFQLFSENVVEVIKEFPQKNYYLRNFDCWVDYRVTILWTEKTKRVKRHERFWTKNFAFFLTFLIMFLGLLFTLIFTTKLIEPAKQSSYKLLGIGLMAVFAVFGIYNLFKWYIFRKTRLTSIKAQKEEKEDTKIVSE